MIKLTKTDKVNLNGFEQRELIGHLYWKDKRWDEVKKLRTNGEDMKANLLVFEIRESYGVD